MGVYRDGVVIIRNASYLENGRRYVHP